MLHYFRFKLLYVLAVLLLAACSSQSTPTTPSTYPGPNGLNPYPGPNSVSPYPGPQDLAGMDGTRIPIWPTEPPSPEPGKASISGTILSFTIDRIIPGTIFYLTPATGPDHRDVPAFITGPDEDKGDVRGMTDAKGQFVVNNIPPGNYYLILWAPYDWLLAENSKEDPSPRLIELDADAKRQLGIVYVGWP